MTTRHWRHMTTAELTDEYSPSSCLPGRDYRPFITAYRQLSDRAWDGLDSRPDVSTFTIEYGSSPSQTCDVAVPMADELVPVLIYLHGGYWQELSKLDSRFAARQCVDADVAFVAVDYTLAPAATLDEIVEECGEAVAMVIERGVAWGIDPNRVVIAGSSAGAHLASMLRAPIAGRVLLSGIYELEPLIPTSINDAVGLDVAAAERNSPLLAPVWDPVPTVIAFGEDETDQFKEQSRRFGAHLVSSGVPVSLIEAVGRNHFDIVFDLVDPTTDIGAATVALLRAKPASL